MTKSDPEAPLDPNILIGTCVAERFELEEVIATGPASFVYRATDAREGGVVAVKLLLDDREYADVSTVKHPGFVRTLERGRTEQGVAFVVSELAEGRSVAELFASEPPSSDEAIRIVLEVGKALAAAHAAGVAHGSIKASEVMVGPSAVRILDLGGVPRVVARPSRTISARVRLMAHVLGGASEPSDDLPSEPAPPPQPRDDVYALGALLRQMLSESGAGEGGREPTVGVRVEPRMQAVLRTMLRALSKDVAARHADAGELVREIESASTASETPPPSTRRTAPGPIDAGALIGRTIGQRYRIERVIGRGSTAIVFQARHLELESKVALKVLAPVGMDDDEDDFGDRFRFEAQVLAELRHPNVIDVFDLGSTGDGLRYIAMELLDGETLAAMLKTRPRLAPSLAVHIACQTAEALSALHERGLVHRDVKPANIFVSGIGPRPRVKLMDFGLARVVDSQALRAESEVAPQPSTSGPRRRQKTLEGIILGTAAYMSPELIQAKTLDARSDIYALAVVTYRMITGTMPFSAEDLPHLLARHICEPAASLRSRAPDAEIPEALERAVLRGLEKNRELRPASALDFAEELRTGLVSSAVVEEPASSPAVAAPAAVLPRKLRARGRTAAALAVVLGAITLIALFGARKAPQGAGAPPEASESIRAASPAPVPLPPAAPEPELDLDGVEETRPARAPSSRPVRSAASRPARAAPAKIDDLKRPAFKR